jgi:anti-sigma B factor antagonist
MHAGSAATLHPWARRRQTEPLASSPPSAAVDEQISASLILAIVNAQGVVDTPKAGALRGELSRMISAGATRLLVDLSRAEDITATAMNALLAARQRLYDRGGKIAVVLSPAMRRRFETLRLDSRFLLADDRLHAAELLGLAHGSPPEAGAPRPHAHAA